MPAFYTIYRIDFKDVLTLDWRIDIQEYIASQGTITELTPTGNPLFIEFDGDDEYNSPIKPSKAVFNVYSTTDFSLMSLYSNEDFHYKVIIYKGAARTSIFWQGFIATGEYSEPYDPVPYPVQITAVDGLNYLKQYLYKYKTTVEDDTYYSGRYLEHAIIFQLLSKIKITTFTEYINIYEESMASGSGDSPMNQLMIDVDVFKDIYCWEVLSEILKKYNAVIRQWGDKMIIYRPEELTQATIYGRIHNSISSITATSFTTTAYINRTSGTASNLLQFPGSVVMIKRPAKKVTINQDYGYKESWIDNWDLKSNTYNNTTDSFTGWTCSNVQNINQQLPEENAGLMITAVSVRREGFYYASQTFGTYLLATDDILGFSFDYFVYSYYGAALANVYLDIKIKADDSDKWLKIKDDKTMEWSDTEAFISILIPSVDDGRSGWVNFARTITEGLPTDGEYTITVYNPYSVYSYSFFAAFKNFKIFATSDEISVLKFTKPRISLHNFYPYFVYSRAVLTIMQNPIINKEEIVQKQWTVLNAINGIELEFNYILGDVTDTTIDNVIEQFAGSIGSYVSSVLSITTDWNTYTGTGGGRTSGAQSKPLLEIIGDEIANQYSRPKQLIQMNMKDNDASDIVLNTLHCVRDELNLVAPLGATRKFAFNRGELDVLNRLWQADLIEIIE